MTDRYRASRLLLRDAAPVISQSLTLMKKIPELRPFVIVEDTVTKRFVQFCTVDGELRFDVPALSVDAEPCGEDVDAAAQLALNTLRSDWPVQRKINPLSGLPMPKYPEAGLPETAELEVTFDTTKEDQPS